MRNVDESNEAQLLRRARRRVGLKVGWTIHASVFVLVNLGLFALNAMTGGRHWAHFPLLGWGLGLAVHGIVTLIGLNGDGVRERMLQAEVERLRGVR